MGIDPTRSILASKRFRYNSEVLLCEPWEEIYAVDEERTMSFENAIPFHGALIDAYDQAGYTLVEVPRDSVEKRSAFVRDVIAGR